MQLNVNGTAAGQSYTRPSVPTCAGADVWRAHAIVTPGARGHAGAPLTHAVQLQVEEEARFAGQAAIRDGACGAACRTVSPHGGTSCG